MSFGSESINVVYTIPDTRDPRGMQDCARRHLSSRVSSPEPLLDRLRHRFVVHRRGHSQDRSQSLAQMGH